MARPTTADATRKFQQRAANSSALPSIENTQAPDYLPQAGKDLWNVLLPELARNGAKAIDTTAFSYLCLSHGLAVESAKTLQQEGLLVADRGDSTKKNPAFQTLRDAVQMFNALAAQFGLSPGARAKIASSGPAQPATEQSSTASIIELARKRALAGA